MKAFTHAYTLGKNMKERYENGDSSGICAFGSVSEDGAFDSEMNAPCHAGLDRLDVATPEYVVDLPYPRGDLIDNLQAKKWARYVLERSPFSGAFAERTIDAGWRRGYFIFHADVDANLLAGCLVALRANSEMSNISQMFDLLTKAGADEDMAFFASYMTGKNAGGMYVKPRPEEGHVSLIPSWFTRDEFKNFLRADYTEFGIYSEVNRYGHFNSMWGQFEEEEDWEWTAFKDDNVASHLYKTFSEKAMDVLAKLDDNFDKRVALFNHNFNLKKNTGIEEMPIELTAPIFVEVLNNYRKEMNV